MIKMKYINKYMLIMMVCLFIIAFSSCGGNQKGNNEDSQLHDWAKEYEELGSGLTLGLVNDYEPTENGVVYLDKISDTLNVQFANLTEHESEYILKVFYDYEEVSYAINGNDTLLNSYVFTAASKSSLIIPLTLDADLNFDDSHFLTIAVLTAPNKNAVDLDMMSNSYGMVGTYELTNKSGARRVNEKQTAQEPKEYLQIPFQGLMLNTDFKEKDDAQVFFPPKEIKVKGGEAIKLAYRVGNYENTDDVLFIVLVDWQQQRIDGKKPFIHLKNRPDYIGYGVIEMTAPLEKGKYDITGFVISGPFELRNAYNFNINDTCYRFTITVE